MVALRQYQEEAVQGVYTGWQAGKKNMLLVLPTGAGKTVVLCYICNEHEQLGGNPSIFAHRSFLLYQISCALAEQGVYHKLHASVKDINICGALHTRRFGRSYIRHDARTTVTSVDKFYRDIRKDDLKALELCRSTTLWVCDEAHHMLADNKWGSAAMNMQHAYGLGVTATPKRADGWGLGTVGEKGVFHDMFVGVNMSQLIAWGNLTDYDLYEPPVGGDNGIDLDGVGKDKNGDWISSQLVTKIDKREITGDVVKHYLTYGRGKLCVVFAVNIEHCEHLEAAYIAMGVRAKVLTSKNTPNEREEVIEAFGRHEYEVLINCDLFGEGFDLPAIEMVQMVRPTDSWSLYIQQFGRALRPLEGKGNAIILDHVGNWRVHGLPDQPHTYSLEDRQRRAKSTEEEGDAPLIRCTNTLRGTADKCNKVYRADLPVCPNCNQAPVHTASTAGTLKTVGGELVKVDPAYIASLRGKDTDIDDAHVLARHDSEIVVPTLMQSPSLKAAPLRNPMVSASVAKNHTFWQAYQTRIRPMMDEWLRWHEAAGINKSGTQAIFLRKFNVDIYTATVQKPKDDNDFETALLADLKLIRSTGGVKYV